MSEPHPWWVYILRCGDGTLYTGMAADVERREAVHNSGRGAKYTRSRLPVRVVYREICPSRGTALRREAELKRLPRAKKLELIRAQGAPEGLTRPDAAQTGEPLTRTGGAPDFS